LHRDGGAGRATGVHRLTGTTTTEAAPPVDEPSTGEPQATPTTAAPRHRRPAFWVTAAVAVGAGVWAVAGSFWLFPLLTDNADEGAYLSQSAALRAGNVYGTQFHPEKSGAIGLRILGNFLNVVAVPVAAHDVAHAR